MGLGTECGATCQWYDEIPVEYMCTLGRRVVLQCPIQLISGHSRSHHDTFQYVLEGPC